MAILGCTNPAANNYDPSATQDDGSCVFLVKVGENCYYFQEVADDEVEDKSFTLSYSIEGDSWVFYHDYIPDFYIGTRKQLYTSKNSQIWQHNAGPVGMFYDQVNPAPFFIDIVFNYDEEVLLDSIQWFTETLNSLGGVDEFATFNYITIWNSQQCTGKLPITDYVPYSQTGIRKTVSQFSFNEIRDIVIDRSGEFIADIFSNFRPIDDQLDATMPWYEKRFMQSNYFIVRLEYDNVAANAISLHSTDISGSPAVR